MAPSMIGLTVGLVLGLAAAFGGVTALLVVVAFAAVGFFAGRAVEGEVDVSALLSGRGRTRR